MAVTRFLLVLLLVGCHKDKESADDSSGADDSGTPALPDDLVVETELIGIANLDDDDADTLSDWEDDAVEGENELVSLALDAEVLARGSTVELVLAGDLGALRVSSGGAVVLDETTSTVSLPAEALALDIEFGEFNVLGTLSLRLLDDAGAEVLNDSLDLRSAPLILNNHWQVGERVAILNIDDADGNGAMVGAFEDVLGDRMIEGVGTAYGYDVWVQDEFEFATSSTPDRQVDVVIDSVRSNNGRYLDDFPEENLSGPDVIIYTWGGGRATSQDSFGNLEVTPPITVDGVSYPYGRIYYGDAGEAEMTDDLQAELAAQQVQSPFVVDVSWLCVGHVDEFVTFLPDPSAPKGFVMLLADIGLGYELLESLDPDTELPYFDAGHGFATIGEIVEDEALRAYNEDLQSTYIEPALETFKAQAGIEDADIIRIPGIFEKNRWCGGYAVSLIPGTINMTVVPLDDGSTHLFMPDPFLRADPDDQGSDPFIAAIAPLLPASLEQHWVDNWDWYHMGLGEVHCGTNTQREQTGAWWDDARHLLESSTEAR